jgi:ribonuclease Z
MGLKPGDISAVFLTHFHSDHIDGLGELATLRWFQGAHSKPLQVYGPEGINQVVDGLNMAYEINNRERITNFNRQPEMLSGAGMEAIMIPTVPGLELYQVFKTEDFEVLAFNVSHMPSDRSLGYKVIYKDRSAVISGDTVASQAVTKASIGADLLVHNALSPRLVAAIQNTATELGLVFLAELMTHLNKLHATPMQAAEVAQSAGVKHLLYYHVIPPLIAPGQGRLFLDGAQNLFPDYTIGRDGVVIALPANSDQVIVVPSTL